MIKLNLYRNVKVLVTGSTGFKGSWMCYWLFLLGAKVYGISLKSNEEPILFNALKLKSKIKQFNCDVTDYHKLNQIIKSIKPDIVFHLAAQSLVTKSFMDPLSTINTNVYGTAVIFKSFIQNNCNTFIFCSSDKCYKNKEWIWGYKENDELGGIDPYSSSKAAAEIIFHSFINSFKLNQKSTKCASVRAGNVIGGGDFNQDRLIPDIIKNYFNGKTINIKNPSSVRPWQFVLEPLSGYLELGLLLLTKSKKYKLPSWNFGPDFNKIYDVDYIIRYTKKNIIKDLKYNLKKNNKIYESKFLFVSNEKAKLELGWKPRLNLEQTLDFTFDWYNSYKNNENILNITNDQIEKYYR